MIEDSKETSIEVLYNYINSVKAKNTKSDYLTCIDFLYNLIINKIKSKRYIAVTEVETKPLYVEPINFTQYEFDKIAQGLSRYNTFDPTPKPVLPQYMSIPMSEETFKFIESVSNVFIPIFGEKEYKINNLKFKMYTKEEYEKQFGKYECI